MSKSTKPSRKPQKKHPHTLQAVGPWALSPALPHTLPHTHSCNASKHRASCVATNCPTHMHTHTHAHTHTHTSRITKPIEQPRLFNMHTARQTTQVTPHTVTSTLRKYLFQRVLVTVCVLGLKESSPSRIWSEALSVLTQSERIWLSAWFAQSLLSQSCTAWWPSVLPLTSHTLITSTHRSSTCPPPHTVGILLLIHRNPQ